MLDMLKLKNNTQSQLNFAHTTADYLAHRLALTHTNLEQAADIHSLREEFRKQSRECGFPRIGRFLISVDRSLSH